MKDQHNRKHKTDPDIPYLRKHLRSAQAYSYAKDIEGIAPCQCIICKIGHWGEKNKRNQRSYKEQGKKSSRFPLPERKAQPMIHQHPIVDQIGYGKQGTQNRFRANVGVIKGSKFSEQFRHTKKGCVDSQRKEQDRKPKEEGFMCVLIKRQKAKAENTALPPERA